MPCTVRMISIIRRQSTNLCRAFFILCQWSCANPHALVRMIMIASPRGETRLWLTITRNVRPMRGDKTGHQPACHSHAADIHSQWSQFRAYGEPAPCSVRRLPQITQRYAPKRAR